MKTTSITIWYRRGASGVRTTLRNMFGTGEGPLGYEPHSETCSVQEKGLWGTNYSPERVWYRRRVSGVRTALRNVFGTGDGPLGYELHSGACLVQERGLWGTNYSPERVWYRCNMQHADGCFFAKLIPWFIHWRDSSSDVLF